MYIELSQAVVDSGCVPLLVLAVQEPEMDLKRIAASALSDISKHSPEVSIYMYFIAILLPSLPIHVVSSECSRCWSYSSSH